MQVGNASISLARGKRIFFAQQLAVRGQSSTDVSMGFFIERGKRSLLEDILNEISNVQ